MAHLIDKAALVAEIEKCYNECLKRAKITDSDYWNAKADSYRNVLVSLDNTLEVKEVDFEKELDAMITPELKFHKALPSLFDVAKYFFELGLRVNGYHQAEKDLLENEHEKSWRLDEKLWKGIKDIEEASYQYMYDASNDWAYDIPIWKDVQDAFKSGAEWKGNYELTWKDIAGILNITNVIANDDSMEERLKNMSEEEYCQEVLKRFKEIKNDATK